ncbi:MAG: hypothetical protein ACFB0A_01860 [Croceivirga sp.]
MRTIFNSVLLWLFLWSCKQGTGTSQTAGNTQAQVGYEFHELIDQNLGIPKVRVQIPKNWEVYTDGDYYYHGPNDMKISNMVSSPLFPYAENNYSDQSLITTGKQQCEVHRG